MRQMLALCLLALVFAANEITLDVEGFRVGVKSTQIPAYEFYLDSKPSEVYGFRLTQIYEAVDGKKVGPVENPRDWTFSEPVYHDDAVLFTMDHLPAAGPGAVSYTKLSLFNKIFYKNSSQNWACPNSICVKIDVEIENYVWQSQDPTASLVMIYWLYGGDANQSEAGPARNNQVRYGESWFSIKPTAQAIAPGNEMVDVPVSMLSDKSGTWVVYSHFNGTLLHDPTIGIGFPNEVNIGLIVGLSVVGVLILAVIIVGIVYYARNKRASYETIVSSA